MECPTTLPKITMESKNQIMRYKLFIAMMCCDDQKRKANEQNGYLSRLWKYY